MFDDPQLYPGIDDSVVWEAITRLLAADLRDAPNEYLYGLEDFKSWLRDVSTA